MVLGVIALIVVGPKELPALLRTIGRYAGLLKQQAAEFRQHFDQAMKEAELDQLKNDITGFKGEIEGAARDAMRAAEKQAESADRAVKDTTTKPYTPGTPIDEPDPFDGPDITDENGMPIEKPVVEQTTAANTGSGAETETSANSSVTESGSKSAPEKTGAAEP